MEVGECVWMYVGECECVGCEYVEGGVCGVSVWRWVSVGCEYAEEGECVV